MTFQLKVLAVFIGAALFISIIELVRRRKLREEFAWLWLLTGIVIVTLSLWFDLLAYISRLLGIWPSAALFFFGLLFLLVICLHQSMKISKLTDDVKKLAQEHALHRSETAGK